MRIFIRQLIFSLLATASGLSASRLYLPDSGVFAFEVEDQVETDNWTLLTDVPGYSGAGYFRWDGANLFAFPAKGFIKYRLQVDRPGTYGVRLHNYHGFTRPDEHNDIWVRFNQGDWIKIYNHATFRWNWISFAENAHEHPNWNYLTEGENTFEIGGRSNGFAVDRVHLYQEASVDSTQLESLEIPLSNYEEEITHLDARFVGIPNAGKAPLRTQFDLSLIRMPEGRTLESVEWHLGDLGANTSQTEPEFVYSLPGTYTVSLTLTDDLGQIATHSTQVVVTSGESKSLHVHEATSSPHYGGDHIGRLLDGNAKTRWSINELGGWAQFDLGGRQKVSAVELAFFRGYALVYTFDLLASIDGETFFPLREAVTSNGTSEDFERFTFPQTMARYVRVVGNGNSTDNFTQITRSRVLGLHLRQGVLQQASMTSDEISHPVLGDFDLKHYPWIHHENHGYFYPASYAKDPVWVYNLVRSSWSYVGTEWYPWIYDNKRDSWVYLMTTPPPDSRRYAYSAESKRWELLD